jgi:hypothetical protein
VGRSSLDQLGLAEATNDDRQPFRCRRAQVMRLPRDQAHRKVLDASALDQHANGAGMSFTIRSLHVGVRLQIIMRHPTTP